jgi:hypothetical protein
MPFHQFFKYQTGRRFGFANLEWMDGGQNCPGIQPVRQYSGNAASLHLLGQKPLPAKESVLYSQTLHPFFTLAQQPRKSDKWSGSQL